VPKASVEAELGAYFTPHESFSVTNIGAYVTTGTTSIYTSDVTSAGKNFRWSAVYVFSPTEFTGLFELSGAGVNLLTDPDVTVTVPTGGFAIVINNAVHSSGVDSRLLYAYASENWVGAVSSAMSTSFLSNNINYAEQQGDGSYTGVYISPYDMELGTNTLGTTDPKIITGFSLYDYGFEPGLAQENTEIAINFTTEWAVGTALLTSSKVGQSMTLGELTGNNYWYWHLAVCEWSEADDAYVVTAKYNLFEDHTNVEIPAGGFILGVHSASADFGTFAGLKAGNKVYLYNVDPLYTKPGDTFADAYFSFPGASTEEGEVPVTPTPIAKMDVTNNNAFLADVVTLLTRVEGNAAATIGEISAIFEGDPEDYNYFYLAVVEWSDVNARYEITAKYDVLGRPAGEKTDVVVPADGFIIAVHGGVSGSGAFINSVEVGDAVYLYTDATDFAIIDSGARDELANTYFTVGKYDYSATVKYYVPDADTTAIDNAIDQIRNLDEADFTEETWADFIEAIEDYFFKLGGTLSVFGGVGPYVDDVTNLSDETEVGVGDLTLLVDGDKVSGAGNWGSFSGAVLFNNKVCTDELLNPTVELVLNLDEVRTIDKVILDFYHCYNVMIGLPRDNEVRLSYSVDGVSYTSLGTFTFDGAAAAGEYGVIEAVFDIGEVDAQYIGVEFNFGPSPFETDGKVVWEFISLTEVSVAEPVEVEPFSLQSLVDYIDAGGFDAEAQTLLDDAAIDIILAKNELVPNVILGDLDGDGEFTATDINLALNGIAGLAVLDIAQELAADVDGDGEFTATDINVMLNMIAGLIYDWPANN
jgi:hypothetical protein